MNQKAITAGIAAASSAIAFIAGGQLAGDMPEALPEPEASSELLEYQVRCNLAQSWHTLYVHKASQGRMSFTMGESHRPPELAALYAKQGRGIANSLHIKRLAQDKMLVQDGKITFDPAHYTFAGSAWEAGAPAFGIKPSWGGRFNDAVHFGCQWQGVK